MGQAMDRDQASAVVGEVGARRRLASSLVVVATMIWAPLLSAVEPAKAQSFNVRGTSGYLSEWELSGRIEATPDRQGGSLTGAVVMKHTGLCSQDGPVEKTVTFRAKILRTRASARIDGIVVLNEASCTFGGPFAGGFNGAMDCPDAKGVPVTFILE